MKPRICFLDGMWRLTYGYYPRQMWVFGMNAEERKQIADSCIGHHDFATLTDALDQLKYYYRSNHIRRESRSQYRV